MIQRVGTETVAQFAPKQRSEGVEEGLVGKLHAISYGQVFDKIEVLRDDPNALVVHTTAPTQVQSHLVTGGRVSSVEQDAVGARYQSICL
jgi:hypothetical protein